jgi:hypothetical protein
MDDLECKIHSQLLKILTEKEFIKFIDEFNDELNSFIKLDDKIMVIYKNKIRNLILLIIKIMIILIYLIKLVYKIKIFLMKKNNIGFIYIFCYFIS